MPTEAEELHRIISASVRDVLDAYRPQAARSEPEGLAHPC
jgi:hypothetical protein